MTQRTTGWILILAGFALMVTNLADAVNDLQNWHGASTPQFIAVVMRQIGVVIMSGLGGKLLPTGDRG